MSVCISPVIFLFPFAFLGGSYVLLFSSDPTVLRFDFRVCVCTSVYLRYIAISLVLAAVVYFAGFPIVCLDCLSNAPGNRPPCISQFFVSSFLCSCTLLTLALNAVFFL